MSQRNRIARVSGLNNNFATQEPERGSFFSADGAPGVTAGPATGFSVAFGLRQAPNTIISGAPWVGAGEDQGANTQDLPRTEFVAGAIDLLGTTGWAVTLQENLLSVLVGDSSVTIDTTLQNSEFIGLMSFIPDDTEYGGVGATLASLCVNGLLEGSQTTPVVYVPSGTPFTIGGTEDAGWAADPVNLGGLYHSQLSSLWITEGIPTLDEANEFFRLSMDAGIVLPQAWAPPRTAAAPNPATPQSPTGNYWTANDISLTEGLGSTWADKLGAADLTRVSPPAPGAASTAGNMRVEAREPGFFFINPLL